MKTILFILLFSSLQFTQQSNLWPLIKGQWYAIVFRDDLIDYRRSPFSRNNIDFFLKDSCRLSQMQADDVYRKFNYKWSSHADTLKIYLATDTFLLKVLDVKSDGLYLKPILPKKT